MKYSKYNFIIKDGNKYILYNALSDQIVLLLPAIHALYLEHRNHVDDLKHVHPNLYIYLIKKSAIVEDSLNETEFVVERWKQRLENSRTFCFTINPTMSCNMNCWYCYETKDKGHMDEDIIRKLEKCVERVCQNSHYDTISFSFFGGEPLLYFDKVVSPLIQNFKLLCKKYEKGIKLHFTTNGYLINQHIFDEISDISTSFQITLDGNSETHNKVKKVKGYPNSYTKIVENIKSCLFHQCHTTVRLNFTQSTISCFSDVVDDFIELAEEGKKYLTFNLQRVWQDHDNPTSEDLSTKVRCLENKFVKQGFKINPFSSNSLGYCYADEKNSAVINYDGNVFKCTARNFTPENADGILGERGDISWNDTHAIRKGIIYGNDYCRECSIFPLCHGGCSQFKLEHYEIIDKCQRGLTEEGKQKIIENRIKDLMTIYKMNHIKNKT